ncbi:unnamed protein product, partial [Prorocentrum cordatum]
MQRATGSERPQVLLPPPPDTGADQTWSYDTQPPVSGMACCTSRGKPKELSKPKGPVWETADLTWWDFQRRRWRTLWLMRTIFYRLKKTAADTENLSPE